MGRPGRMGRREVLMGTGQALAGLMLGALACKSSGDRAPGAPPEVPVTPEQRLLDEITMTALQFFWNEASGQTGMVKDRAQADGRDARTVSSIAATGFGLTALCIADQRRLLPAAALKARVTTTLEFILNELPHEHGFFYHFVDMNTGARAFDSEVSSIDTSILLCGVLTARQHFDDATIRSLATQIYHRVDWPWMRNGGDTFSMGWKPETGFLSWRWDNYCELMMLYLLAIGSPTHPVPASAWDAFSRPVLDYQGIRYITANAPLFIHQFSHAWFDFRGRQDAYTNYYENSVKATKAHQAFCLSLSPSFPGYTESLWGISASDSRQGYVAWGGPPSMGPIDGSVVPCATGGSIPFAPTECLRVLRHIRETYPLAWGRYGFVDAFHPLQGWYNPDVIGIDLGVTMLMAENHRTQLVWQTFMKNPEVGAAMDAAGF